MYDAMRSQTKSNYLQEMDASVRLSHSMNSISHVKRYANLKIEQRQPHKQNKDEKEVGTKNSRLNTKARIRQREQNANTSHT